MTRSGLGLRTTPEHASAAPTRRVLALVGWDAGYNRAILRGIRVFARRNPNWILRSVDTPTAATLAAIANWPADGYIAHLWHPAGPVTNAVRETGKPIVNLLTPGTDYAAVVDVDDLAVGRTAAQELIARGFRHFAMVSIDACHWSQQREKGYRQELLAAGHGEPAIHRVPLETEVRRREVGYITEAANLQQWLTQLPKPVAVFAANDPWGREVAEACRVVGLHVPEQVAIVGADNDDLWCEMAQPELSSVAIPWTRLGFEAAAALERVLSGKHPRPEEHTILIHPTGVRRRQSSDVLAVPEPNLAEALQFVRQHADQPITVADILRRVPVDRRWLERACRTTLGRSPLQEIHRVKVERAQGLLTQTDLSIPEIAHRCGMSIKQFTPVFRRMTGTTPTAYRHESRIGHA